MADIPVDRLTKAYIKIRDKRSELRKAYEAEDSVLKEKLETIQSALLDYCKDHNVDSVRTPNGLFYRTTSTRYWTSDWEAMNRFILENELPEFYEKRLNQGVVREFLEENPETVPPGLNTTSEYSIRVRKK
jgi:hypothetical protein